MKLRVHEEPAEAPGQERLRATEGSSYKDAFSRHGDGLPAPSRRS